jgi:hypothetical protein
MSSLPLPRHLAPGASFYLVFVTRGTMRPSSTDIAVYDAFVTSEARRDPVLAAVAADWRVIGSTDAIAAVTHLGALNAPIYRLDGELVAANSAQLFAGVGRPLRNPIVIDQFGDAFTTAVLTGSTPMGQIAPSSALGNPTAVTAGSSAVITTEWISSVTPPADSNMSFYGISSVLSAQGAPPTAPSGLRIVP